MKKRKDATLLFEVEHDQNIGTVEILPGGQVQFFDRRGRPRSPPPSTRTVSHDRQQKAPKTHSTATFNSRRLSLDGLDELCGLSEVLVVDSSQSTIPWAEKIAFSFGVRLRFEVRKDGVEVVPASSRAFFYEFKGFEENPERLAILTVLHELAHSTAPPKSAAVVTDSDLSALPSINRRKDPLYGAYFLPSWCQLIYAGDTGHEVLNSFMRMCDSGSKRMKRVRAAGEIPPPPFRPHPLVKDVLYRQGYQEGLTIEHPLLPRRAYRSGENLQAFGIPTGGGEKVPLSITHLRRP